MEKIIDIKSLNNYNDINKFIIVCARHALYDSSYNNCTY